MARRASSQPGCPSELAEEASSANGGAVAIICAAVFAIVLPAFLILFNVSYLANSEWLYDYGWWRNDIVIRTGLPVEELKSSADQIKEYFGNDAEFLDLQVNVAGNDVSLYKKREVLHMVEVKALMQGVFAITRWSGIALILMLGIGGFAWKREAPALLLKSLRWSAIGTGALLVVFASASAINFRWVFTQFHFLSFADDLWQLDARADFLIIMFPQQFFFDATVLIGLLTVIEFAIVYGGARYLRTRMSRPTTSAMSSGATSVYVIPEAKFTSGPEL